MSSSARSDLLPPASRRLLVLLVVLLIGICGGLYWQARSLVRAVPAAGIPGAAGVEAVWLPDSANPGGLTIDDVVALDTAGALAPMPPPEDVPVLNARKLDGRWFRFRITNDAEHARPVVLDMVWNAYDRATLYQRQAKGGWREVRTGKTIPSGDASSSARRMAFDLLLPPDDASTVYVFVEDFTRLPNQFHLWWDQDDFLKWERFETAKAAGYLSLLVAMGVYGLFAYATLHQRDQLIYAGIVGLYLSIQVWSGGVGWSFFSGMKSPFSEMGAGALSGLISVCFCMFTRSFFELAKNDPAWDRVLRRVQWGLFGCAILMPLTFWPATAFANLMTIFTITFGVWTLVAWVGVRRWRAGHAPAALFVLAFAVLLLGRLQYLIKGPDVLVRYDEQILIGRFCTGLGLLVLGLAAAYRHRLVLGEHLRLREGYTARLENDVAERTRVLQALSDRLAATVAERDRILAIIGHDLRGPASSLQSLTRILVQDEATFSTEELRELAKEADQMCSLQLELLNNLLVWGGAQAGHARKPESLLVRDAIAPAWKPFLGMAGAKRISISDTTPPGLRVCADASLLETILRNLLANAVKFTRHDGHIDVGGSVIADGRVEVRVVDDGVGIDSERLRTLFDGGANSTPGTNHERGAGLGLALCRDLARTAGGDLRLESEIGRGTTAILTLPAGFESDGSDGVAG